MNTVIKIITANKTVRKATTALGVTLVGGLGLALADGDLTGAEVLVALGTALVTTAGVWRVENERDNVLIDS